MWIDVAKLYPLYEKTNQSFQSASWYDTDEAEARELKASTEVNPVPQETLKKMNDGPLMMNRLRSFPRAPESFCPSITTFSFFLSFIFFVILLLLFF